MSISQLGLARIGESANSIVTKYYDIVIIRTMKSDSTPGVITYRFRCELPMVGPWGSPLSHTPPLFSITTPMI